MKSVKKIFVVLAVAMLMFSMVLATSYGVNVQTKEKKDTGITIESQSKTVSYKVTWNGNGGKIGSKKTTITNIKKGSKIGKLATTPKRNGYTFKGWYTKKTGGAKITKNTKPTKSTSYFAQWNKNLNAEEKKLVGTWSTFSNVGSVYDTISGSYQYPSGMGIMYTFSKDGTYDRIVVMDTSWSRYSMYSKGSWRTSGNTIYCTNEQSVSKDGGKTFTSPESKPNFSIKIRLGIEDGRQYFVEKLDSGDETLKRWKG